MSNPTAAEPRRDPVEIIVQIYAAREVALAAELLAASPEADASAATIAASPQEQREVLKRFLVGLDQKAGPAFSFRDLLDQIERPGRNALHFLADQLDRDGAEKIFRALILAYPDFVLQVLDDSEG